jgi:uncharacterized membrane protein
MPDSNTPTPGEITCMAGGGVAIIASFLDFLGGEGFGGRSAWSSGGLFPLGLLIALFSLAVAVQVALARFANMRGEPRIAGLTWKQVNLMFGFFAVVLTIAWLIVDIAPDKKIGYWGMAIGAIAVFVGTILMLKEDTSTAPGPPPSAPPAA